ncbi:septum formation family protein [Humidisolicoccus flavus]|uniref:septum formation family protein n=1 Tax=Humidisolicoccus flavus TaxID=3111414 RepID=UPI00324E87D7
MNRARVNASQVVRWHRVVVAIIGAALIGGLSACASVAEGASTAQSVGDCFDLRQVEEVWAASPGNPAVECDGSHTTEVFQVGELEGWVEASSQRPSDQTLLALSDGLCEVSVLRAYMGAAVSDSLAGISVRASFPDASAWAEGERWYRCDAVSMAEGVPVDAPMSVFEIMSTAESAQYRVCYEKEQPENALHLGAEQVSCADAHTVQDVNGWIDPSRVPVDEASIERICTPYVLAFLGVTEVPDNLAVGGVVVGSGAFAFRCVIGGEPVDGYDFVVPDRG